MKSLLIVEDVDAARALLEMVFQEFGKKYGNLRVSGLARNGAEARFELVRRRPDLVVLDEILPGESSLDLLEEFRVQEIPVFLLTSLESRAGNAEPLPRGALGRILKPNWQLWQKNPKQVMSELSSALAAVLG